MGLFATLSMSVLSDNLLSVAILYCYAERHYAEGPHAVCRGAFNLLEQNSLSNVFHFLSLSFSFSSDSDLFVETFWPEKDFFVLDISFNLNPLI